MHLRQLYQWVKKEAKHWQGMTRHEIVNIEVFSRGVVRAESSHIRRIAGYVGGQADSQRRRLQRFVSKAGTNTAFFQAWSGSVVRALQPKQVVLAVDETKLLDRIGVMVVGLVIAERCIPLAWRCYEANDAAAYPAEGQVDMIEQLLVTLQAGLPAGCQVRVLADRGIGCSPKLMRVVMGLGWTFLFRVTKQSKLVLADGSDLTFYEQVHAPGQAMSPVARSSKNADAFPAMCGWSGWKTPKPHGPLSPMTRPSRVGSMPNACGWKQPFVTSNRMAGTVKMPPLTIPSALNASGFCWWLPMLGCCSAASL